MVNVRSQPLIRSYASLAGPSPRIAHQATRRVLEIAGPDAQKFLKGQMCKDVDKLGGGYTGFLNASGRVLHTAFAIPTGPGRYLISHDSEDHPNPLEKLLPPFRLRAKVRIKDVTNEWDVWSAWGAETGQAGPVATWRFGSGGAAERVWSWDNDQRASLGLGEAEVGAWDLRAGWGTMGMGRYMMVPKGQNPSALADHDLATLDDYNLHRMLLGVPEGIAEIIPGQALPLESDMDIQGGVDFRKGCYLGQELTVRTYFTGATRKRILPVRLFPLAELALPLASIESASPCDGPPRSLSADVIYTPPSSAASKKPRSAGRILSLHRGATAVGLGLLRLEFAERAWWAAGSGDGTVGDWLGRGSLTADIGGKKWGVWVGKGEAYGEALRNIPPPAPQDDE